MNHRFCILLGQVSENKMFYFSQIASGIEIFSDKKCQVTFGFEYFNKVPR